MTDASTDVCSNSLLDEEPGILGGHLAFVVELQAIIRHRKAIAFGSLLVSAVLFTLAGTDVPTSSGILPKAAPG